MKVDNRPPSEHRPCCEGGRNIKSAILSQRLDCDSLFSEPLSVEPWVTRHENPHISASVPLREDELIERSFCTADRQRPDHVKNSIWNRASLILNVSNHVDMSGRQRKNRLAVESIPIVLHE